MKRQQAIWTLLGLALISCFDRGVRWEEDVAPAPPPPKPECIEGQERCTTGYEKCVAAADGMPHWQMIEECDAQGKVCAISLGKCTTCLPSSRGCKGQDVVSCSADGNVETLVKTCDVANEIVCRSGDCVELCAQAAIDRSNVGCEYWAVDLDNAMIDSTSNAAAQQFAVVVSNPQPDVPVEVKLFQDNGQPGDDPNEAEIATAIIAPLNLRVFKLGPREVDGSPDGEYNTGTHTALTRHAYKIKSNYPVVAYQFNPLENVNVFSNDASLLKPVEALVYEGTSMRKMYVVAGWPQTIAATDDPDTNFSPNYPIHLRAFLTIVGTRPDTTVRVHTKTKVVPGGPIPETPAEGTLETMLGAYDVLNLETGDFNADFTGSVIEADGPIAVFTGGEASDAPHFSKLSERRCCADHLEDQLDPLRTAGKRFVIAHSPSRTRTVAEAGGQIPQVPEPDYVRVVAASPKGAAVTTTLPPPYDKFQLNYLGDYREVQAERDMMIEASEPVIAMQVSASQDAANVKRGLPGGDPSIVIVPPTEQYRMDYVFLTPDKYAFDFITVVAPPTTVVAMDGIPLDADNCWITPSDGLTPEERGSGLPPYWVYTCQVSFAAINPLTDPPTVSPGIQNDGVHRVAAGEPVGVFVSGFDSYVSYGYAGGSDLKTISPVE